MLQRAVNLSKLLGKKNSAFLFGPRGVGKSKLCEAFISTIPDTISYNLLEFETFQRILNNPQQFSREVTAKLRLKDHLVVFVDEIQKVPALLDEVHNLIEANKGKVQFLLSGSSARKIKKQGANLLAGRALNLKLHPVSIIEDLNLSIEEVLHWGTLPGIIYDNEAKSGSLRSYVETYLKEEIQQEAFVRKIDAFSRFLEIAAQYHGHIINASDIAKNARVSAHTVNQYFQILEDTLLGWRIYGWAASVKKQLSLAPKWYLFDNGVCNALRGEITIEPRPGTSRFGNLFEAYIIQECIRISHYKDLDYKFSYWRTSSGQEVDLIISRGAGQPLAAIEIKSAVNPEKKDVSGLHSFKSDYPKTKCFCISNAPMEYAIDNITVLPWKKLDELLLSIHHNSKN